MNILVIKLGALGDFVQALGPMRAIRAHHPDAHITLLTTKPFLSLAEKTGYFNAIEIDSRPKWYQFQKLKALRQFFIHGRFDRVYDLQNNDRTALYLKLFSPRPEWVGAAKGASHRNASPERIKGLAFDGHCQTLALAGIQNITIDRMEWMTAESLPDGLNPPYALLVAGCAPSHPHKRWPVEHFAVLAQKLAEQKIQPVLIGTQDEEDVLNKIAANCPTALNLCNRTKLFDLPALARGAAFAIGNDTGPMHMMAPTGCRTIVLFSGKSNPKRHAPLGDQVIILQDNHLSDLSPERVIEHLPL